MNLIQHTLKFNKLLLVWQETNDPTRLRYVVAALTRTADNQAQLEYLKNTVDYKRAKDLGFSGYPAFSTDHTIHINGVLDAFMRRIPSRKREDFGKFLENIRLKNDTDADDLTLLGYSGASLPGDDFTIFPSFENQNGEFEILMDVAGFRYTNVDINEILIGTPVSFERDIANQHDTDAVKIFVNGTHIGFVPRILLSSFHEWQNSGRIVSAIIERKNGQADRPVLYIFVKIRQK